MTSEKYIGFLKLQNFHQALRTNKNYIILNQNLHSDKFFTLIFARLPIWDTEFLAPIIRKSFKFAPHIKHTLAGPDGVSYISSRLYKRYNYQKHNCSLL
jgi:hypothetical protein